MYEHQSIFRIQIGRPCCGDAPTVAPGTDVNGNGVPDVVLFEWNGGAVQCCSIRVIELADPVREIAYVAGGRVQSVFCNADQDSALEVEAREPGFACWPAACAGSPSPKLIMDWTENGLSPSCLLTFRSLGPGEFEERRVRILNARERDIDHPTGATYMTLFQAMADFYYIGQKEAALRLFDESIPSGDAHALELLVEFGTRLERSSYWKDLSRCAPVTEAR